MRFEFKVKADGKEFWTQLQGSGGQVGNGCLHLDIDGLPSAKRQQLFKKLLARAKAELELEGTVRVWKGDHLAPANRIEELEAQDLLEIRYIGRTG